MTKAHKTSTQSSTTTASPLVVDCQDATATSLAAPGDIVVISDVSGPDPAGQRMAMNPVPPVVWWWGTNRPGGPYYAGRVHVVDPNQRTRGVCGLPVTDVWELRPPVPLRLCPDCCVYAMAATFPAFAASTSTQPDRYYEPFAYDECAARANPAVHTGELPALCTGF